MSTKTKGREKVSPQSPERSHITYHGHGFSLPTYETSDPEVIEFMFRKKAYSLDLLPSLLRTVEPFFEIEQTKSLSLAKASSVDKEDVARRLQGVFGKSFTVQVDSLRQFKSLNWTKRDCQAMARLLFSLQPKEERPRLDDRWTLEYSLLASNIEAVYREWIEKKFPWERDRPNATSAGNIALGVMILLWRLYWSALDGDQDLFQSTQALVEILPTLLPCFWEGGDPLQFYWIAA